MAGVELEDLTKIYPNGVQAITDLSLTIEHGEFLVLVGPSGCGKSTALRMIAGLEEISAGTLRIGDRVVNDVAPKDRDIAMVFQNYALYPHMSVYDNIAFALKLARVPRDEIDQRVRAAARTLELTDYLDRKPARLSGGQRQRVAMGRAIVRQPSVFLMDEPLSNLDAKLRVQMRAEIAQLQRDLGVTTFYVTHDQVEAMTMGDRVAVIRAGLLQQVDTPQNLYDHPTNMFIGAFIGSPSMNLYEATLRANGDDLDLQIGGQTLLVPARVRATRPQLWNHLDTDLVCGIRPEHLDDASVFSDHPANQRLDVKVNLLESLGSEIMVHFGIDARRVDSGDPDAPQELSAASTSTGVARVDPRSRVRIGEPAQLTVDVTQLHYFDRHTGSTIAVR